MPSMIDNAWYDSLGSQWFDDSRPEIALLRREGLVKNRWVKERLAERFQQQKIRVLELGCGAAELSRDLAQAGHEVTAADILPGVIQAAQDFEKQLFLNQVPLNAGRVFRYLCADACQVPLPEGSFDAVCALDLLEHVEHPVQVVAEAARLLAPGGAFFFHTFSQTFLARLCGEWVLNRCAQGRKVHDHRLFLSSQTLGRLCFEQGLVVTQMVGLRPQLHVGALVQLLMQGTVSPRFGFCTTGFLGVSYAGMALKIPLT